MGFKRVKKHDDGYHFYKLSLYGFDFETQAQQGFQEGVNFHSRFTGGNRESLRR